MRKAFLCCQHSGSKLSGVVEHELGLHASTVYLWIASFPASVSCVWARLLPQGFDWYCCLQEQRVWQEKEANAKAEAGAKKAESGKEPPLENGADKGSSKEAAKENKAPTKGPDSNGV